MGEEIRYQRFKSADFKRFSQQLRAENDLLRDWFESDSFSTRGAMAGYELEAWLVDEEYSPCPHNGDFLRVCNNDLLSPELAKFNVELNVDPQRLTSSVLRDFEHSLRSVWHACDDTAHSVDCRLLSIGILPTLRDEHLTLENISTMERYRALNEQVMSQRRGETIHLNIIGEETLASSHRDVMLEAASTSLQIHTQIDNAHAAEYYNVSALVSAPMVAVAANSPILFGRRLWQETRIPVFEQSVPMGGFDGASHGPLHRVGFGSGFVRRSLFECFEENIEHFPVLLPVEYGSADGELRHLRLHNGTIWRWNRPLIGFDDDGTPHLRIEHRVAAAAPSALDNVANIAFYYGLAHYYTHCFDPIIQQIDFATVKDNFYLAAQHGIDTHVDWVDGERHNLRRLILDRLLVEAETGLHKLDLDRDDIQRYLGIIEARVKTRRTGSRWQCETLDECSGDLSEMAHRYHRYQQEGRPVHEWGDR